MCKVSIVLPTYNGSQYIIQSIESILNQSFQDFELIIVDDCSTDNTYNVIKDYISNCKFDEVIKDKIKIIRNDVNQKLPASLNNGFRIAKGKYWTWTSDDNYYDYDAIEKMVDMLERDDKVGLVYADSRLIDDKGSIIRDNILPEPSMLWKSNVVGACFLYRADIAKMVGEYSLDRFLTEDYEYWIRMSNVTTLYHLHEFLYNYRIHSTSLSATRRQEIIRETTRLRLDYLDALERCCKGFEVRKFYNSLLKGVFMQKNDELYENCKKELCRRKKWYRGYLWVISLKDKLQ